MSEDVPAYGAPTGDPENRAKEMSDMLTDLGMSARALAVALDEKDRQIRYWLAGDEQPPLSIIYAMRYLVQQKGAAARRVAQR